MSAKDHHFYYQTAMGAIILIFLYTIISQFNFIFDKPYVEYKETILTTAQQTYKPNDQILFRTEVCSKKKVHFVVNQRFQEVDTKLIIPIPSIFVIMEEGCQQYQSIPKRLPDYMESGTYTLQMFAEIPGHTRTFPTFLETKPFKVIP